MSDRPQRPAPTPEQRRAADPARHVWVSANAGSGKTHVLVERVIRLLLEGAAPDTILCLTYTKAAAAEMAERLFSHLGGWAGLSDADLTWQLQALGIEPVSQAVLAQARRLFAQALETPGGLKIQTIHAFAERLLQLFPVESGLAPGFSVLTEQDIDELFEDALLDSLVASDSFSQSAFRFLDDGSVANLADLRQLARDMLSGATGQRARLLDPERLAELEDMLKRHFDVDDETSLQDLQGAICGIDENAYRDAIAAIGSREDDAQFKTGMVLRRILAATTSDERVRALCQLAFIEKGTPRGRYLRKATATALPSVTRWLEQEAARIEIGLPRYFLRQAFDANLSLYRAMAVVAARIELVKRSRGQYDFDDLITRTVRLLQNRESAQWVLYKLDKGLSHILVDEAQDTSPAQWTIVKALAETFFDAKRDEGPLTRSLFVVGDIKQSIFSFQGADAVSFNATREQFKKELAQGHGLHTETLALSFRSNQHVLDVVNAVFKSDMPARLNLGGLDDGADEHSSRDSKRPGLVELWPLELPDEKPEEEFWKAPVDRIQRSHPRLKLAARMADAIQSWIGRRKLVGHDRPVAAGDILILVQKRNALYAALLGALRLRNIPVAGADRLQLQNSLVVQDMLALGQVLRLPLDDLSLACVLKSPLAPVPVSEDELLHLAAGRGAVSLWSRLPIASANRRWLDGLRNSIDTPHTLFSDVLSHARLSIRRRLGPEAEDAAYEFLNLTLDYEQRHGTSLTGFLEWFRKGDTTVKREMDKSVGAVRILTVHGSKGLEAPIVMLADTGDVPQESGSKLHPSVDLSGQPILIYEPSTPLVLPMLEALKEERKVAHLRERTRLLYVAMTRAADELYICGGINQGNRKDVSDDSWYRQIETAFDKGEISPQVRDIIQGDGQKVKRYGADPTPLVQEAAVMAPRAAALPDWALVPAAPRLPASLPPVASRNSDAFDKRAVAEGIAIHQLVERMAETSLEDRLTVGQRWAKRLKLADGLAEQLLEALSSPALAEAFGPEGVSEQSIEGHVEGLGRVFGRVDRLHIGPREITLVDIKTNRQPPRQLAADHPYALQMARYVALLEQAFPGRNVRAGLWFTQIGNVMWLEQGLLSRALDLARAQATSVKT